MHGGDIYRNKVHTDFSVNINPLGIPEQVREKLAEAIGQVQAYPDERCEELREKLAMRFGLQQENVLCGNGASELLLAISRWRRPKKALLLAPGFSGYRRALRAGDCRITHFYLRKDEEFALTGERAKELAEKLRNGGFDLFILTNPSNPTGKLTELETVRMLAKTCEEAGTVMVVDECFMELTAEPESYSMTKAFLEYSNILVLRAFTKTFAIPGIRLGYLLCKDEAVAKKIALQLPEWNVSLPAQAAGIAALEQEGYLEASRVFVKSQRAFLEKGLQKLGAKVYQSDANFLLFQWKDEELYEKLLKQGYLIRDCQDYEGLGKGYYRIAVKNRMENEMLLQTIETMQGSQKR
ncbi:MAG: aminotransferase class I/II-fold pyridoxal phosphate-dependent enzyme [Lachnospiraceae bacterium]|nr:aminotransferase class I/II-fold pyridoxal phosphate-dependent enzyme [Lachnospiraceae bacterium]MBR3509333.1 aminotransferase class I/II-fold pyridoxal phosphate-dependent enzyme [Lachnospiraceae bacterium]MBR4605424.1 aminotransferase class I/II-fold pyridoxal phosphate-dependent enzyme [Lachnospiraceae bacterium]